MRAASFKPAATTKKEDDTMASGNGHDEDKLYRLRHSTAHVMAQAVLDMFPEGKLAFGPPVENGFYYDFDLPRPLTTEDLAEIEQRMKAIIDGDYPFVSRDVSADEARKLFADQPYKLDQINKLASARRTSMARPARSRSATCRSTPTTGSPTCAAGRTWRGRARSRPAPSSC